MEQKVLFKKIFIVMSFVMLLLPVIVTFSSLLTTLFDKMGWYVWLQDKVVPVESRLVAVIAKGIGIDAMVTNNKDFSILVDRGGELYPVALEWNCLGWQSIILLAITFVTGLQGSYTSLSKLETILIGVLGTFLINLFRMALIVALAFYWSRLGAVIIHDYFASFVALIWMLFFWWFSYSYVLEPIKTRLR